MDRILGQYAASDTSIHDALTIAAGPPVSVRTISVANRKGSDLDVETYYAPLGAANDPVQLIDKRTIANGSPGIIPVNIRALPTDKFRIKTDGNASFSFFGR